MPCTANANLRIPCTTRRHDDDIDGCPAHLPVGRTARSTSAYDVAAWADLWFYSNPIFIEVKGSTLVAGVK